MKRYLVLLIGAVLSGTIPAGGQHRAFAEQAMEKTLAGRWLTDRIFIRGQMTPADIAAAKNGNFKTIVDLRPDGEAPDMPSSAQMAEASGQKGIAFHYVPVPHTGIPDEAVVKLAAILDEADGKVLIYCRSGSRAARTWALVEASRPGGADAGTILGDVRKAGFLAEDLRREIDARIAARTRAGH